MLALPLLSSLSTISAVAAAPTILRSQLQVYPGGRCLDNPHGELYEGHLVQWWDCAGIDPNRQGLVNPNQGWRPDGQKWRYIADENWCLGFATNGFAVMARCEGYGPDVRSTDWVHAGDIGRLCSQWNIDYCLLDNDDRNGEYAVVWDDLGRQASIQFNEEGFDSL
ncbi:hypothetical protein A1Q2_04830 [Trichosporon asahii var. asahii CBS 8904]|uniref:Uncharacterized protein n=1 Tax=Trichosporon asahii var. asahii (strain CBS 8904) TaxID=1220162 RepID=K1VN46_TRIAC|nr:hypothetical protein A1Q2_04830 [Trichosporon asahii var. asahii CBS 8904]